MRKKVHSTNPRKKKVIRDLPDGYYVTLPAPMTRAQVEAQLAIDYEYLVRKIGSNFHTQLEIVPSRFQVTDALNQVVLAMLPLLDKGNLCFMRIGDYIGYVLRGGWRQMSTDNQKKTQKVDSGVEGGFSYLQQRYVALDTVAEPAAPPRAQASSRDLRDDYQAEIWVALWEHLADAVVQGKLSFRDLAIYKHYMLHKHVLGGEEGGEYTINTMAAENEFSRKQITTALQVVKAYVAAYVATMPYPNDEPEDVFGY